MLFGRSHMHQTTTTYRQHQPPTPTFNLHQQGGARRTLRVGPFAWVLDGIVIAWPIVIYCLLVYWSPSVIIRRLLTSQSQHLLGPSAPPCRSLLSHTPYIAKLAPGIRPPEGSPKLASFLETQSKFRAGVGASIWVSRAHTTHTYPTNIHCGSMSCPSDEHYKSWFHSLCYIRAHPSPLVIGCGRKASLSLSTLPAKPFGCQTHRELGLHATVGADLSTPTDLGSVTQW